MDDLDHLADPDELRNHLAAIVASSDDAIVSKTLDGIILSWNAGAARLFGYTAAEVIGKPVTILIPPDHLDEEPEILGRLRRGERIDHYETVRIRKDGSRLDIALTVSPIRNSQGRIVAASKIARDITLQKRASEALAASDARFRILADSAPVLIWMADTTRAYTWFNKIWREFTGRALEDDLGSGWTRALHPRDLESYLKTYTANFDARTPFRTEHRLAGRDGAWHWVINQATPLFEGHYGRFSGYVGSCIDITEFRQAQSERDELLRAERAARSEAERLSQMKDEFLATLSHELRTPLNAILGWTMLLRRLDRESPEQIKGLETIERNARVQTQIIGDLLDMSRIISGKVQLHMQSTDLNEVVSAAIDVVRPSADAKRLRLRATLDGCGTRIQGDPSRLQQVMWNLLANAVKFTPAGGRIDVLLRRVDSNVEVSVEDSGAGIKPEFLAFVFDRFRQADSSTTRRHGGLGLGLSIVRYLVELHGGSVQVRSAGEGQGASFTVAFPISAIRTEKSGRHEWPTFGEADLSPVDLPSLSGITALVVDDEEDARTLIDRLISERGGRAVMASSAEEALQLLAKEAVDIMISDIGLPEVDGYQLIRRVRGLGDEKRRNLIAIALTAYARAEDRERALLAGYQMHMSKPAEPRELIAGIASLVNVSRGC